MWSFEDVQGRPGEGLVIAGERLNQECATGRGGHQRDLSGHCAPRGSTPEVEQLPRTGVIAKSGYHTDRLLDCSITLTFPSFLNLDLPLL